MSKVFIIAEAGVNHNGKLDLAKELARVAKESGADAVKFQTFKTQNLVASYTAQADYQEKNIGKSQSQADMLRQLELTYEEFRELSHYCEEIGILFLSTAFDLESVDFLADLGMPIWKIPSGEITNLPYLEKIAGLGKPMIISTGMAEMNEIEEAVAVLKGKSHQGGTAAEIMVLHCTTEYPAPDQDVNLLAMQSLKERLQLPVGYSDHTEGDFVTVMAVAMGASVIEKHFTLDKDMEGPDHKASLNPEELTEMIQKIRRAEKVLGDGVKKPTPSEEKVRGVARKCIVAKEKIAKGETFSEENLTVKRAGAGISPMRWYDIIGKKAERDYQAEEAIEV